MNCFEVCLINMSNAFLKYVDASYLLDVETGVINPISMGYNTGHYLKVRRTLTLYLNIP